MSGPSYQVALSFAGEQRWYVEEVAKGLKACGVSVFYDRFERPGCRRRPLRGAAETDARGVGMLQARC